MSGLAHDAHNDLAPGVPVSDAPRTVDHPAPGVAFWSSMAAGALVVAFGLRGLVAEQRDALRSIGTWFVGGALALDLVLVPVAAAIGWAVKRLAPDAAWPAVRAALLASAVLIGFALPLVAHQGGKPDNPSLRPRHYGAGLTWSLVAVWAVALVVATSAAIRARRSAAADG